MTLLDLSDCDLLVWKSGAKRAVRTRTKLGVAKVTGTRVINGVTCYWSATDGIARTVTYSEVDPAISVRQAA